MLNRLNALTTVTYFDRYNSRHIDISTIRDAAADLENVNRAVLTRIGLPDLILTYDTEQSRNEAIIAIKELLAVTYQGSPS